MRGPAPSPHTVPSITANVAGCSSRSIYRRSNRYLMHVLVRVMADLLQKATERVLDRTRRHGVTVGLHRGQMHDLLAAVERRDLDPIRKDLVQLQERTLEPADLPLDLRQRGEGQPQTLQDQFPSIVPAPFVRIGHDRSVLEREDPLTRHACVQHRAQRALELPRLHRAGGKVLGPRQVELDNRVLPQVEAVPPACRFHQARVVLEHRRRPGLDDRDQRRRRGGRRTGCRPRGSFDSGRHLVTWTAQHYPPKGL